jgi:hypothetical protein
MELDWVDNLTDPNLFLALDALGRDGVDPAYKCNTTRSGMKDIPMFLEFKRLNKWIQVSFINVPGSKDFHIVIAYPMDMPEQDMALFRMVWSRRFDTATEGQLRWFCNSMPLNAKECLAEQVWRMYFPTQGEE